MYVKETGDRDTIYRIKENRFVGGGGGEKIQKLDLTIYNNKFEKNVFAYFLCTNVKIWQM